ncbi:MAG: GGDEF domain-containing protein [Lachnospiraceae bacterium]|nr:GGDEF domain-containing protein [Lachnospiraceae bacterium]
MQSNRYEGKVQHDIGISIMLVGLLLCAIVLYAGGDELFTGSLIMTLITFAIALLASFQLVTLAIVLAGVSTVTHIGIRIFQMASQGSDFSGVVFLWLLIPGLTVLGATLYVRGQKKLQTENALLRRQVEELVMIDPLTNLYNLRSMFMDMQTQVSFAERNNQHISLMVIKMKYHEELKKVLKKAQYEQVLIKVSKYVVSTVRLEDRVYAIDDEGSLAIILTTDKAGCKSVVERLNHKLDDPDAFTDISTHPIRVEVKIGYLEYDNKLFKRDAKEFLAKVVEECDFDD